MISLAANSLSTGVVNEQSRRKRQHSRAFITSGFNTDKANQKLIDGVKHLSNEQLLERWARMVVPKGLPAWSPDAHLMDDWVQSKRNYRAFSLVNGGREIEDDLFAGLR